MHEAKPHIEQILVDTEYVISFARSRALSFVEEGRAQLTQAKLLLIMLVGLSLVGYLLLSSKLRQEIYRIYGMEEHNATFDELCGSYNRRSFIKSVEIEIQRSLRHDLPLSLLMMDLDHFKHVNDDHGHNAGDIVLRQFGAISSQHLRSSDLLGRMGGEEFAILLPQTELQDAMNIAERIRQNVAEWDFKIDNDKFLKMTVSIGMATLDSSISNMSALLKRADEAMYRAKNKGRHMVAACNDMGT